VRIFRHVPASIGEIKDRTYHFDQEGVHTLPSQGNMLPYRPVTKFICQLVKVLWLHVSQLDRPKLDSLFTLLPLGSEGVFEFFHPGFQILDFACRFF
jgi:hypothetical protein